MGRLRPRGGSGHGEGGLKRNQVISTPRWMLPCDLIPKSYKGKDAPRDILVPGDGSRAQQTPNVSV